MSDAVTKVKENKKSKTVEELENELKTLCSEMNYMGNRYYEHSETIKRRISEISSKIDEDIKEAEKIYKDLTNVEKESGDELDKLILDQIKDLSEEE
ncbi:hypothetical protein ACFLZ4_02180 [Patescibacteria group bacterium]